MTSWGRPADLLERMDDPDCDRRTLERTYARFGLVNRLVAGWRRVYRERIRPLLAVAPAPARLLDLGCGGGDVLRALLAWAARDGFAVDALGVDPDPRAIAWATRRPQLPHLRFRRAASADLVAEGSRYDLVLSNHVLHHLTPVERAALFADSTRLADRVAIHSDIRRSRLGYALYAVGAAPLSPGTFLLADGLTSIRRSLTPTELAAELPDGWRVETHGPFRLLAVREGDAA